MISLKFCHAYEYFRQINFAVAICWAAGKGLDLLQVDLVLTRVKKERAKRASLRSRKKNSRTFRMSKKGLKKTKCPACSQNIFLEFLQNFLF